jgi:hypothetical protein
MQPDTRRKIAMVAALSVPYGAGVMSSWLDVEYPTTIPGEFILPPMHRLRRNTRKPRLPGPNRSQWRRMRQANARLLLVMRSIYPGDPYNALYRDAMRLDPTLPPIPEITVTDATP